MAYWVLKIMNTLRKYADCRKELFFSPLSLCIQMLYTICTNNSYKNPFLIMDEQVQS